jgi:hypothetical protein
MPRFVKGDPRCWRGGRPKTFFAVQKLAQSIANEPATASQKMSVIEKILRGWAESRSPILQQAFVAYCYGRPPEHHHLQVGGTLPARITVSFAPPTRDHPTELPPLNGNRPTGTALLADSGAEIDR